MIVTRDFQHLISDIILSRPIRLHDRFDQIFRHVLIIRQKLLCIFWQAITTITKGRIVVKFTDSWIQTDTIDNFFCLKSFHFCIGIQFIEIGNPHGQIGIGKEFHRFRFRESHEAGRNVFFDGSFLKKRSKVMSFLHQPFVLQIRTRDDAAGIQVIVESLAFAEKLRTEDDTLLSRMAFV